MTRWQPSAVVLCTCQHPEAEHRRHRTGRLQQCAAVIPSRFTAVKRRVYRCQCVRFTPAPWEAQQMDFFR